MKVKCLTEVASRKDEGQSLEIVKCSHTFRKIFLVKKTANSLVA